MKKLSKNIDKLYVFKELKVSSSSHYAAKTYCLTLKDVQKKLINFRGAPPHLLIILLKLAWRWRQSIEIRTQLLHCRGGGGVKLENLWNKMKEISMNNIGVKVLITNRPQTKKTSNHKHEQSTLKLDKSQLTKIQKQKQGREGGGE